MHIPQIGRPRIGGTVRTLKKVCLKPEKAAKKSLPGIMLFAQSLSFNVNAPAVSKLPKLAGVIKPQPVADIFEAAQPTAEFLLIKGMIKKTVPDISDEFVAQVIETAERVKCSPEDLTALLYKESKFKPDAKNGNFGGLGQMNKTSLKLSITHADKDENAKSGISEILIEKFLSLPREKQMPYVRNYILAMKNTYMKNPQQELDGGELYSLFYTPGRINRTFLSSAKDSQTVKSYYSNKNLDFNRDSVITKHDLQCVLNHVKNTDLNIHLAKK